MVIGIFVLLFVVFFLTSEYFSVFGVAGAYALLMAITAAFEMADNTGNAVIGHAAMMCFLAVVIINTHLRKPYNRAYRRYIDAQIMAKNTPPTSEELWNKRRNGVVTFDKLTESWLSEKRLLSYKPFEWFPLARDGKLDKYMD